MAVRCAVLTISDRSYAGQREDASGPILVEKARKAGWDVVSIKVVPDDFDSIRDSLISWCDQDQVDLVLTTGGTGFSGRDITPEATLAVIQRSAPGLAEAMRQQSLAKTPHAMLSRGVAGIRSRTLIINLPGSPVAASENLDVVIPVISHAVELLHENPHAEQGHHFKSDR
jgi:molybdopterin adenylyltransferase